MKKKPTSPQPYRTEEQLKQEARERAAERARIQAAKPPPSQGKQRADNFWYHYKWHTLGGVVLVALVLFFVKDVLLRTKPDITILLATATPIPQETVDALQAALETEAEDRNGDGKVSVVIDAVYVPVDEAANQSSSASLSGGQQEYAAAMKLTTVVAAGTDPLYLLDDALYNHLLQLAAGSEADADGNVALNEPADEIALSFFEQLESAEGGVRLPLSATSLAQTPALRPLENTAFSLRTGSDKNAAERAYCRALLVSLSNG